MDVGQLPRIELEPHRVAHLEHLVGPRGDAQPASLFDSDDAESSGLADDFGDDSGGDYGGDFGGDSGGGDSA